MMKIIVILGKKSGKKTHLLLELLSKKAVEEVKSLIRTLRYQDAISDIISKGKLLKHLAEKDLANVPTNLIITETNAYWDLI